MGQLTRNGIIAACVAAGLLVLLVACVVSHC